MGEQRDLQVLVEASNATGCDRVIFLPGSPGYRQYSFFWFTQSLILMISCLIIWHKRRAHIPFLEKRNFSLILLMCIGFLCNQIAAPLSRYVADDEEAEKLRSKAFPLCIVINFAFFMVIPVIAGIQITRVLIFRNRIVYNQKVAIAIGKHRMGELNETELKDIEMAKYRASDAYGVRLGIVNMFIAIITSTIFVMLNCPILPGKQDHCTFPLVGRDGGAYSIVVIFMYAVGITYVFYITRKEPDPFEILKEMRFSVVIPAVVGVVSVIFGFVDPGNFNEKTPVTWSWNFIADVAVYSMLVYTLPVQIVRSQYNSSLKITGNITLNDIVPNDTAMKLFEQHLLNEFSAENLTFWKAVKWWKDKYDQTSKEIRKREAENIIKRWLDEGGLFQINTSAAHLKLIRNRLEASTGAPKNLFDEIHSEIYNLMNYDSFARFKRQSAFKQFIGTGDLDGIRLDGVL